jgi:hypothetical protein
MHDYTVLSHTWDSERLCISARQVIETLKYFYLPQTLLARRKVVIILDITATNSRQLSYTIRT